MDRTAIVTGGTRGLGKAIALKADGMRVAAVYHGNQQAAEAFSNETGIETYKWDVSDFEACKIGIARIEQHFGLIDVLVNNAGITRDATLHHMPPEQWWEVIQPV